MFLAIGKNNLALFVCISNACFMVILEINVLYHKKVSQLLTVTVTVKVDHVTYVCSCSKIYVASYSIIAVHANLSSRPKPTQGIPSPHAVQVVVLWMLQY